MKPFSFILFVAGATARSERAQENLEAVLRDRLSEHDWEVELVDVLQNPDAAEEQRILATPTLIRVSPMPRRKLVGDLSDREALATALSLPSRAEHPPAG